MTSQDDDPAPPAIATFQGPASSDPPAVYALGPYPSDRAAQEAALVLRSMDVPHELSLHSRTAVILLHPEDADRARRVLSQYQRENVGYPPRAKSPPLERGFPWVVLGFLVLVAFFVKTGPAAQQSFWFAEGTSVAELVLQREPYRAATALTLHGDASHVLGNALSGAVFGHALSRRMGSGVAAFTLVGAGILGNLANAAFYELRDLPHRSYGASTAVMAGIGALAAAQIVLGSKADNANRAPIWRVLAPLGAGLALLSFLGSSESSDLGAHGFGFLAGIVLGLPLAAVKRRLKGKFTILLQLGLGVSAVSLIASSWWLALR